MCVWGQSRSCLLHPDLTCRLGHCPTSLYLSCYTINTFESRPRERPGTQGTQRRTRQRAALRELVNWCGVMLQVCDQLSSQEYKLSVHCLCAGSWGVQGRLMESPRPGFISNFPGGESIFFKILRNPSVSGSPEGQPLGPAPCPPPAPTSPFPGQRCLPGPAGGWVLVCLG